ncbi:MAG TPA: hypothetical protein VJN93_01410 [Candidatus Acidoferrum sp.]|nr:hypothetical protein [Candidatus Acidoferrum sp.]
MGQLIVPGFAAAAIMCAYTFASVTASPLCGQTPPASRDQTPTCLNPAKPKNNNVRFTLVLIGNGVTADFTAKYFKKYKDSDGNILYETWIDFHTETRAADELRGLARGSLKIICKESVLDNTGKLIGARILVVRSSSKSKNDEAVLAWTAGSKYQELRSNSLEAVIAFEQALRNSR